MTYIVGIVSQKGGIGKSTLARLLACEFVKGGLSSKIADLDTQQKTSTDWASDRAEASIEPEIQVQPFGNIKTALKECNRFDTYIFDGRPHSSQQTIEVAKISDLIVIPTGQTKDDLSPAVKLAHNLANLGIGTEKISFAFVKTTNSDAEIKAARDYLAQTEYITLAGHIPVSTAYGIAHDAGKSVAETPYCSLNDKSVFLAQSIIDLLVKLKENKGGING